ncbi:transcriptional regulator FtsR [Phytomonospora endophytica]|uniref:DNA-binding transcriptional MerR regulator n=1 Tax=Phytomonospora endophytica TaxID=714109 RepID=A0A841FQJ8_9ACTN|nr:MerR family transcriptional regulator [Phytomonospora endophytica]MBB6035832.1 DNA-binding transcriptional MerR regulator [Phytomonospora endophytica]GIG71474.1 MerR family transcriptional regulator [Phytomonospora endophytica]
MSIGEVVAHLRVEFTGLSVSKVRFLEAEGLVCPSRRPSGYRRFSWGDVARLRAVLSLQRDEFLPLSVIRERLDGPVETVPDLPAVAEPPSARYSRGEVLARSGLDERWLEELRLLGLVGEGGREGEFDHHDLVVATVAAGLARFGIEPRHLRGHRQAADRDLALIGQITAPLRHRRDGEADVVAADLAALSASLHAALVAKGLSRDAARR